jgi:hypothetical protein
MAQNHYWYFFCLNMIFLLNFVENPPYYKIFNAIFYLKNWYVYFICPVSHIINFFKFTKDPEVFKVIWQHDCTVDYFIQFNSNFLRIFYICDMSGQMGQEFYLQKYNYYYFLEFYFYKSMLLYSIILY